MMTIILQNFEIPAEIVESADRNQYWIIAGLILALVLIFFVVKYISAIEKIKDLKEKIKILEENKEKQSLDVNYAKLELDSLTYDNNSLQTDLKEEKNQLEDIKMKLVAYQEDSKEINQKLKTLEDTFGSEPNAENKLKIDQFKLNSEKILQLKVLLDQKAISEEEYTSEKQKFIHSF